MGEVCVKEAKACAADKECSTLHEKLQAAMKKDGGYGGKGGDGKYDDKKEGGYGGKDGDKKKDDYDHDEKDYKKGGKDGDHDDDDHDDDDKKKEGYEKKEDYKKGDGKKGRQLHQHGNHDDHKKDDEKKKDMDGKKENMDKKKEEYGDKKEKEPSAELKAAVKACTENELCKQLMECMKKHTESGGKGDGKGDHEEVCVKEAKACAADKECSTLHEKLLHYKLQDAKKGGKDGDYGGKGGDGKYDDKKEGGYGGNDDKK